MFTFSKSNIPDNSAESYRHNLQLYKHYPEGKFPLKELESICMQRVEILLFVERIYIQTGIKRTAHQCKALLLDTLKRNGYDLFAKIINGASKELGHDKTVLNEVLRLRRNDHISHFMLRGVFSSYESRWFHIQELRLFYWRLYTSTIDEIKEFLSVNQLKTHDISEEENEELQEYIKISNLLDQMPFYKVPFTLVMDLVQTRKVFLRHGMAFVPEKELAGLCFGYFKENLAAGLRSIAIVAADAAIDPRINQIFNTLNEYFKFQQTMVQRNDGPSLSELDDTSKKSYPLCMRMIHEMLRKSHHLAYGARLQYSLFLKSIGVTLDDAMELWKQEFTKVVNEETFETEYGYRLRHIYGHEGSQVDYNCYKCSRIINFDVKPTECYGCPFKHLSDVSLREKLNEYKFEPEDIEDIVKLSTATDYQGACKRYYEITCKCSINKIFSSPLKYFRETKMIL